MRHFTVGSLFFVILLGTSCSPIPASPVSDQLTRGKVIYEKGCATENCHGTQGEGIPSDNGFRAWPLVGENFQRRNPTAQVVFDVVRSGGEASLRALTDQEIYDSIAYELSLNSIQFSEALNSQNAATLASGAGADMPKPGEFFPPPGNAELLATRSVSVLPLFAENSDLRLRLTQIAQTASIGRKTPPSGGSFLLMVLTFEDLAKKPLEVTPEHLRLITTDGQTLATQEIGLAYPVDRFHSQTIQPNHGTAGLVIFVLPESAEMDHLLYTLQNGEQLIFALTQ
jgi:hypothetical protein